MQTLALHIPAKSGLYRTVLDIKIVSNVHSQILSRRFVEVIMHKLFLVVPVLSFSFSSSLIFAQQSKTEDPCKSGHEFSTTDCSLTWHGITVYGAYDIGVGWVSHGLPENGYNYEGESLVNRNGYQ